MIPAVYPVLLSLSYIVHCTTSIVPVLVPFSYIPYDQSSAHFLVLSVLIFPNGEVGCGLVTNTNHFKLSRLRFISDSDISQNVLSSISVIHEHKDG